MHAGLAGHACAGARRVRAGLAADGRAVSGQDGWGRAGAVLAESVGQQDSKQWRLEARQRPGKAARTAAGGGAWAGRWRRVGPKKGNFFFQILILKITKNPMPHKRLTSILGI